MVLLATPDSIVRGAVPGSCVVKGLERIMHEGDVLQPVISLTSDNILMILFLS